MSHIANKKCIQYVFLSIFGKTTINKFYRLKYPLIPLLFNYNLASFYQFKYLSA
jgi:hypothetical protein